MKRHTGSPVCLFFCMTGFNFTQIAEYWRDDQSAVLRDTQHSGAGFDAV